MEETTITMVQKFNRRGLGYLWNHRAELDPGQVVIIESIYKNKKKGQLKGEQTITYKKSLKKAGKFGYGRFYGSKGSLETLEKECRGTLCKDLYHDLDIINCHPVLLYQLAKSKYNKELPELEYYINNRDEVLKMINDNRDDAKQEIISILYGGRNKCNKTEKLGREIHAFSKFLANQNEYTNLYDECKKGDNIYGTLLSYIAQTEEVKCMLAMKKYLESKKIIVGVLAYDGMMIEKSDRYTITEELLKGIEEAIEKETNYKVNVIEKPMSSFDLPMEVEEITPGVKKDAYDIMKGDFETTHFYYYPMNTYGELTENGINFYTEQHARTKFNKEYIFKLSDKFSDYVEFFQLWLKDETRRFVRTISFLENKDPEVYTQAIKFVFNNIQTQNNPEVLELFNELINIVSNNNEILKEYVLNYFAHLLQKPTENPNVSLIMTGDKGIGKDTLVDLLGQYVVGGNYFHNYQSNTQFFDKYDTNRRYKFLVKLEEADRKYFLEDASLIKSLITSRSNTFNPKGMPTFECENFIRYIFTTNKSNIAEMNGGERRFFLLPCSSQRKGDLEFWDKVYNILFTPEAGRIIADYLLSIDISNYNPRRLPKNDFQDAVIESEKTEMDLWYDEWDGEECKTADAYNLYRDFCIEKQLFYANNTISFSKKILGFIAKNKISTRKLRGFAHIKKA